MHESNRKTVTSFFICPARAEKAPRSKQNNRQGGPRYHDVPVTLWPYRIGMIPNFPTRGPKRLALGKVSYCCSGREFHGVASLCAGSSLRTSLSPGMDHTV